MKIKDLISTIENLNIKEALEYLVEKTGERDKKTGHHVSSGNRLGRPQGLEHQRQDRGVRIVIQDLIITIHSSLFT